jgi:hypothetical protein
MSDHDEVGLVPDHGRMPCKWDLMLDSILIIGVSRYGVPSERMKVF